MKLIVDTNIIFSCLLNTNNDLSKIIFFVENGIQFYSCNYMLDEISNHWDKLKKYSKLNDNSLQNSYLKILSRINFINEDLIPIKIWKESEVHVSSVDVYDIDFVALTRYMNGKLWTSDKKLYNYFRQNNFIEVISTNEIKTIFNFKK